MNRAIGLIAGSVLGAAIVVAGTQSISATAKAGTARIYLTHIAMVNGSSGWGTTRDSVVQTGDGGKAWQTVFTVPKSGQGQTDGQYFTFASIGIRRAWAVATSGRGVWTYRTDDGGAKWIPAFQYFAGSGQSPFASQLVFSNRKDGWLLLHGGGAAGSVGNAIIRTVNGGKTWRRVEYQYISTSSPHSLPACDDSAASISFVGSSVGWVTGICGAAPQRKQVFRSTDGGRTWRQAAVTNPVSHLEYFDPGQVVVTGAQSELLPVAVQTPNEFMLYRSATGGKSWVATNPIRLKGSLEPTFVYAPFSAATSWVLVGALGQAKNPNPELWRTTNGGVSWRVVSYRFRTVDLVELDFVTTSKGFALGTGYNIYITNDGGKKWTKVVPNQVPS